MEPGTESHPEAVEPSASGFRTTKVITRLKKTELYPLSPYPPIQFSPAQPSPKYHYEAKRSGESRTSKRKATPYYDTRPSKRSARGHGICNPCCCQKGCCNLRANCIAIGWFLIVLAIINFLASHIVLTPTSCQKSVLFGHLNESHCRQFIVFRAVMISAYFFRCFTSALAGSLLLIGVFKAGASWGASLAGFLMFATVILIFIHTILLLVVIIHFNTVIDWDLGGMDDDRNRGSFNGKKLMALICVILLAVVDIGLHIWFAFCAFQFLKQINAGVDKYTTEGRIRRILTVKVVPDKEQPLPLPSSDVAGE